MGAGGSALLLRACQSVSAGDLRSSADPCCHVYARVQDHRTALHWACSAGHTDIVHFLLGLGVPVNDQDDVTSRNRQEIALMLLENRADPDAMDHLESTPLHRAATFLHVSQVKHKT
uniref:Uncharacterized protein n=1 Tax=Gopherus agassizii TaxID=38772 RepID=A0A452GM21_9SAUR